MFQICSIVFGNISVLGLLFSYSFFQSKTAQSSDFPHHQASKQGKSVLSLFHCFWKYICSLPSFLLKFISKSTTAKSSQIFHIIKQGQNISNLVHCFCKYFCSLPSFLLKVFFEVNNPLTILTMFYIISEAKIFQICSVVFGNIFLFFKRVQCARRSGSLARGLY